MKTNHQILQRVRLAAALLLMLGILPTGWGATRYKVLHNFGKGADGAGPFGPLAFDGKGNLYGVTGGGGNGCRDGGCGTVFKLTPQEHGTWKETVLYNFSGDYEYPDGVLTFDGSGDIYGTVGGYTGGVYELSPSSGGYSFSALYTDGAGPGLLMDDLGNLYGEMGPGEYQGGAIGELAPGSDGWIYTQLHSFDGYDGLDPGAPPIWDGKGNMFGTTVEGGIYKPPCRWSGGCGVVYEMTPNGDGTWTYQVLHRFASFNNDGQNPYYSSLVMDKAGDFYGGTWFGGRYDHGTVYKLAYTGGKWKETILYDFPNCASGCWVEGTLAMDKAGNLYGTAAGGTGNCGYACGVVFKLSPQKNGKWKYRVLLQLNPQTGGVQPFYGVTLDDKGSIFSVTSRGGKYGFGTAFEITP